MEPALKAVAQEMLTLEITRLIYQVTKQKGAQK